MKMRPFELTLVVVFIIAILLSLLFLSGYKPKKDTEGPVIGTVTIWGTVPRDGIQEIIAEIIKEDKSYQGVSYKEFGASEFDTALVNALAEGNGPDVILASHEHLVTLRTKIKPVSYEGFPLRDFKTLYIDGAQIFALTDGIYAYPLMVDPMVMYWNKNILATENFLEAPKTWESLVNDYLPRLIKRNDDRSITRSVVALGEYQNIQNAFGILSSLLLQAGSEGVVNDVENNYQIKLDASKDGGVQPLRVSADFYTRFSKPSSSLYSWNRSFVSDKDRFLSEELVLYFEF
jgi:maltose-binding protein MalE